MSNWMRDNYIGDKAYGEIKTMCENLKESCVGERHILEQSLQKHTLEELISAFHGTTGEAQKPINL